MPDDDTPLDDSDSDLEIIGDVTMPVPVTITGVTGSFLEDMARGGMPHRRKPVSHCPSCGREMDVCAACAKVNTGEP